MTYPHDIDLGPKLDTREIHRILFNGRNDPVLLTVLHYLRDEAADCDVNAREAMRAGQTELATMELGGSDKLIQVFTKLDELRKKAVEPDG